MSAINSTERLISLVMLLVESDLGLTKAQIFDRIEPYKHSVSDVAANKMFDRDKNALRSIGIPLELFDEDTGFDGSTSDPRYRIPSDAFTLVDLEFTTAEAAALAAVSDFWRGGFGQAAQRALGRLDTAAGTNQLAPKSEESAIFQITGSLLNETFFGDCVHAISTETVISFRYRAADGISTERKVSPWALIQQNGSWYLCAYDHGRSARRYFRLSRIQSEFTEDHFDQYVSATQPLSTLAQQLNPTQMYPGLEIIAPQKLHNLLRFRLYGHQIESTGRGIYVTEPHAESLWKLFTDPDLSLLIEPRDHPLIQDFKDRLTELLHAFQEKTEEHQGTNRILKPVALKRQRTSSGDEMRLIFDLISYTVARGGASHKELQERFQLSAAQLNKRLEKLPLYGLPQGLPDELFELEDDGEFVSLRQVDAVSKPLSLDPLEAITTLLGLEILARVRPDIQQAATNAHNKISQVLAARSYDRINNFVWWDKTQLSAAGQHLVTIKEAIESQEQLRINYRGEGLRTIVPVQIRQFLDQLYILAWCLSADEPRVFRLDRCHDLEKQDNTFVLEDQQRRAVLNQEIFEASTDEAQVVLHADYRVADAVASMNPTHQNIFKNGNVLAQVPLASERFFTQAVLSLAPQLVILEPHSLVMLVKELIRDRLELLSNERS